MTRIEIVLVSLESVWVFRTLLELKLPAIDFITYPLGFAYQFRRHGPLRVKILAVVGYQTHGMIPPGKKRPNSNMEDPL
jgi:hypothetical protein